MSSKKLARNAPCPCGSGKKYKHCCFDKGFDFVEDDLGNVIRSVPVTPKMTEIVEMQRQKFIARFGREPAPDDEIFFDMPPLEQLEHETVEAMKKAGLDPAFIYAYEQTGLIVSQDNMKMLTDMQLADWHTAVEEYRAMQEVEQEPPKYPIGTMATYGPDDKTVTKIAAGIFVSEFAEPIIERWVGTGIMENAKIQEQIQKFFTKHGVKSVAATESNMGCPHEEGLDFPTGEDCPFCPFWKGKQGSNRKD
jgi:hypothetical protein